MLQQLRVCSGAVGVFQMCQMIMMTPFTNWFKDFHFSFKMENIIPSNFVKLNKCYNIDGMVFHHDIMTSDFTVTDLLFQYPAGMQGSIEMVSTFVNSTLTNLVLSSTVTGDYILEQNHLTNTCVENVDTVSSLKFMCPVTQTGNHRAFGLRIHMKHMSAARKVEDAELDGYNVYALIETPKQDSIPPDTYIHYKSYTFKDAHIPFNEISLDVSLRNNMDVCKDDIGTNIVVKDIVIMFEDGSLDEIRLMFEMTYRYILSSNESNQVMPFFMYKKVPKSPNYHLIPFEHGLGLSKLSNVYIVINGKSKPSKLRVFMRMERTLEGEKTTRQ